MVLIQNWYPPSKENWELLVWGFQYFPAITAAQWIISWHGAGKTSTKSIFNIPGKIAWITMEVPGFLTLLYVMNTLPAELGLSSLPWENKVMGGLFVLHYLYRAILSPLLNPSMSPIHPLIWSSAMFFQVVNGLSIGGYLSGYGPTTSYDWQDRIMNYKAGSRMQLGMIIFFLGLAGNIWHEDELREIRRAAKRDLEKKAKAAGEQGKGGVNKVYKIPQNGVFKLVLYPHYLCEWVEWSGYWLMAGFAATPIRSFLINEIATMLPQAVNGRKWYVERFGKEKVGSRKAVIPGII